MENAIQTTRQWVIGEEVQSFLDTKATKEERGEVEVYLFMGQPVAICNELGLDDWRLAGNIIDLVNLNKDLF